MLKLLVFLLSSSFISSILLLITDHYLYIFNRILIGPRYSSQKSLRRFNFRNFFSNFIPSTIFLRSMYFLSFLTFFYHQQNYFFIRCYLIIIRRRKRFTSSNLGHFRTSFKDSRNVSIDFSTRSESSGRKIKNLFE